MSDPFQTGLEAVLSEPPELLRNAQRIGLVCNQASLDRDFRHAAVLLQQRFPGKLAALFGPQHGLWSTEQDNMIETGHERDPRLGVPVFSLYSETRRPTAEMLDGLDLLVIDLQDVGTRVYTYVWTALYCLEECKKRGLPVLVLDRPNPLGGVVAEGPLLDRRFESFVGLAAIPMRHGLTIGELMRHLNRTHGIGCDLHVATCRFHQRGHLWPQLGRAWVPPSPNLPRVAGAFVYPGQVLLEGTQLSEGRGTTTPFEVFGAPFIDPWRLCDAMAEHDTPGIVLRPIAFEPTFQKWQGQRCGGVFVHATDPAALRSYRATATLLRVIRQLWPTQFAWRQPPYEYEATLMPIDILAGSPALRAFVDGELPWSALDAVTDAPGDWFATCEEDLLYR